MLTPGDHLDLLRLEIASGTQAGKCSKTPGPRHVRPTPVGTCATPSPVSDSVSVRELRNTVSEVLRRVEGGERVTVTVDRRPVAELVPLRRRRAVPVGEARKVASRHAADAGLLRDLRELFADSTDYA